MSDDVPRSAELEALLSRVRRDAPPRARLDAVRARLEAQLGPLGAGPVEPTPTAPPPRRAPAPTPSPTGPMPGWVVPGGMAAALVFVLAAYGALQTTGGGSASVVTDATTHEAPETEAEADADAEAEPEAEADAEAEPEAEAEAEAEPEAEAEAEAEAAHPSRPPPRERVTEEAPAVPEADTAEDPSSTLREEIAILERAMGHRRDGDLVRARAALAEHARRFPTGVMSPERERLLGELETAAAP